MGPELLGAIAGQASNTRTNLMNFLGSQLTGWQNRKFTREMNQTTYDQNVKLWNMNNEYNTPSAQKQRLIDAGLNPALMYGGPGGGGVASQQPSAGDVTGGHMKGMQFIQGANIINTLYDLEAKKIQNEWAKSTLNDRIAGETSKRYALEEDRYIKHWDRENKQWEVISRRDNKYNGKNWYELDTDVKSLQKGMLDQNWYLNQIELDFARANKWIYNLSRIANTVSGFVKPR